MANNVLGSIRVLLEAATASFEQGMNASAKLANKTAKDIEHGFEKLGSTAERVFGAFSPLAGEMAQSLSTVGATAGAVLRELGPLAEATGGVGIGLLGIAGVAAGASAAMLGIAAHTALAIDRMAELSHSTGISIETLSLLAPVAKANGVGIEELAKSLEKMEKSAFTGAAAKAFKELHVSITDANGQLKPAKQLFEETAAAISKLPDGTQKTALTMEIFGRSGANMISTLNDMGRTAGEMEAHVEKLGGKITTSLAAASEDFNNRFELMHVAFEGITYSIARELIPVLDLLADKFVEFFEKHHEGIENFIKGTAVAVKDFIGFVETIAFGIQGLLLFVDTLNNIGEALNKADSSDDFFEHLAHGDFKGILDNAKAGYSALTSELHKASDAQKNLVNEHRKFQFDLFEPIKTVPEPTEHPSGEPREDATLTRIKERIKALLQESADWAAVAAAGTQAEQLIAEATKKGNDEFGKLKAEAAKDKTGAALPFVIKNEDLIKAAGMESVFGAAIKALTTDLDKQKEKLTEQANAAVNLGNAYQQGGAAIAAAVLDQKFADQIAKINVLKEVHEQLAAKWGASSSIVKQLAAAIDLENSKLAENKQIASSGLAAGLSEELLKQSALLAGARPYIDELNQSYFENEKAVRAARIELELYNFEQQARAKGIEPNSTFVTVTNRAGIKETISLLELEKRTLTEKDKQEYDGALAQEASRYSLNAIYDQSISKLERMKEAMQGFGQNTLLIDAQIVIAQERFIHQWDDAILKVGTFGERTRAVLNEIWLKGQDTAKKIADAILQAYDSLTTQLAKLVTGQKADFGQIAKQLSEQVAKAGFEHLFSGILGHFGIGAGGKPDGSASKPFHVIMGGHGHELGGTAEGKHTGIGGVLGGIFGGIFGKAHGTKGEVLPPDGSKSNPFYVLDAAASSFTTIGGDKPFLGIGSDADGLAKAFGGGKSSFASLASGLLHSAGGGVSGGGSSAGGLTTSGHPVLAGVLGNLGSALSKGLSKAILHSFNFSATTPTSGFGGFLANLFGGGKEEGGDVTPGKAYIVGEKRPELFLPRQSGTIIPHIPSTSAPPIHQTNVTNHFHGVKDYDLFRRNERQISAKQIQAMSRAHANR